jgi:hypothetical protein
METRTRIISAQLSDGTPVKIAASDLGGDMDVAMDLNKILPFKQVTDTIEGIAKETLAAIRKVKPDKASIEFGVEVGIESGALTACLVKGTGTANLKITLEWANESA